MNKYKDRYKGRYTGRYKGQYASILLKKDLKIKFDEVLEKSEKKTFTELIKFFIEKFESGEIS